MKKSHFVSIVFSMCHLVGSKIYVVKGKACVYLYINIPIRP